jgi:dTDP-glucose pyrophosphorylase
MKTWRTLLISPTASIRDAIARIDSGNAQIVLVADANTLLLGTVTDGDVRRGLLRGKTLDDPVTDVMNAKPTRAGERDDRASILALMKRKLIHQVPVVDDHNRVTGLETLDELLQPERRDNPVVLIAGGLGTRLRPLTDHVPKPMLEVGGKPILESTMENLIDYGFTKFYLAVNYKADTIERHFRDGSAWDVSIEYIRETEKLGTAGPLTLLPEPPTAPVLVMNADILTRVNFSRLLDFHVQSGAAATVCVREYTYAIPYGVVQMSENLLTRIDEKPVHRALISAGIYVLEPEALRHLPKAGYYDMPTLLQDLVQRGLRLTGFPIHEYWLDIGKWEDLQRAHEYFSEDRDK